ncbi:MAG: hypothetical protein WCL13_00025 [bacterium]
MKRVLAIVVIVLFFFTSYLSITGCATAVFLGAKAVQIKNDSDHKDENSKKEETKPSKRWNPGKSRWE